MRATLPLLLLATLATPLAAQSVVYTPPPDSGAARDTGAAARDTNSAARDTGVAAPDTGAAASDTGAPAPGPGTDTAGAQPAAGQPMDSVAARTDSAVGRVDTTAARSDTSAARGSDTTVQLRRDSAVPEDTSLTARMDVRRGGIRGPSRMTLIEAARVGGLGLSTFVRLVDAAGWTQRLASGGPYTAFAPSDAAFAMIPTSELEATLRDRARAERFLRAHLAPTAVLLWKTERGATIRRLEGAPLRVTVSGDTALLDEVPVIRPDVAVTNGVIQIVGAVLPRP